MAGTPHQALVTPATDPTDWLDAVTADEGLSPIALEAAVQFFDVATVDPILGSVTSWVGAQRLAAVPSSVFNTRVRELRRHGWIRRRRRGKAGGYIALTVPSPDYWEVVNQNTPYGEGPQATDGLTGAEGYSRTSEGTEAVKSPSREVLA